MSAHVLGKPSVDFETSVVATIKNFDLANQTGDLTIMYEVLDISNVYAEVESFNHSIKEVVENYRKNLKEHSDYNLYEHLRNVFTEISYQILEDELPVSFESILFKYEHLGIESEVQFTKHLVFDFEEQ